MKGASPSDWIPTGIHTKAIIVRFQCTCTSQQSSNNILRGNDSSSYLVAFGLVLERIEGFLHLIAVDVIVNPISLSMGDALRPRLLAA